MNGPIFLIAFFSILFAISAVGEDLGIDIEEFDSWVFEAIDGSDDPLSALQEQCNLELTRISQTIELRNDQKERLQLAGQGDINRFYRRVELARKRFLALSKQDADLEEANDDEDDDPFGNANEDVFEDVYALTEPLQKELENGLFGPGSLFHKAAKNALDPEQIDLLEQRASQLMKLRIENAVRVFVAKLGWRMPLTADQRLKVTEILLRDIKSVGDAGPYTNFVVLYHFSKVPREQYEAIFNEHQMRKIALLLEEGQNLREDLEQEGLLQDEP